MQSRRAHEGTIVHRFRVRLNLVWQRLMAGLFLLLLGGMACAEPLNIYVGQGQMPFADDDAGQPGLFGELMHELCARLTLDCHFRGVPWRRGQYATAEDPQGILLNLGRIPEREKDFVWLLEVLPTAYVLVSPERSFDSLAEALQAGPVVVMGGTPRATEILAQKQPAQQVVEVSDPQTAAHMLYNRRVVAWYEIDLRAHYLWQHFDYDSRPLFYGRAITSTHSYIAGNATLKDAPLLRQQMRVAFEQMKQDGSWRRIVETYLGAEMADELLAKTPLRAP